MDVAKTEEDLVGDDADLVDGEVLGKRETGKETFCASMATSRSKE